jgi:hypothetical protein
MNIQPIQSLFMHYNIYKSIFFCFPILLIYLEYCVDQHSGYYRIGRGQESYLNPSKFANGFGELIPVPAQSPTENNTRVEDGTAEIASRVRVSAHIQNQFWGPFPTILERIQGACKLVLYLIHGKLWYLQSQLACAFTTVLLIYVFIFCLGAAELTVGLVKFHANCDQPLQIWLIIMGTFHFSLWLLR